MGDYDNENFASGSWLGLLFSECPGDQVPRPIYKILSQYELTIREKERKLTIEYLVQKNCKTELKITKYRVPDSPIGESDYKEKEKPFEGEWSDAFEKAELKIMGYETDLLYLPQEEFDILEKRVIEEVRERLEQEEQKRFFNLPYAIANFEYWRKAAYWNLEEATALILNKDPKVVTWEKVEPEVYHSKFAKEYAQTRELVNRAAEADILVDKVTPRRFVSWAAEVGLTIPDGLSDLAEDHADNKTSSEATTTKDDISTPANPFPLMDSLQWKEINIIFISDDTVRLIARDKSVLVTYAEMGFKNRRDAKPSKAWEAMLNQFANTETGTKKDYDPNLKSRVKEIRSALKSYFKIDSDPFLPFKDGGWVPRVRIYDKRGTIEYPYEFQGDAADQWLRDNN
ncbi:MAG: hypothetical protein AB2826_09755 [Candidatus Thiodiazotropha sp.]